MKKRFTHEDQAFLSVDFSNAREIAQLLRRDPEENKVRALLADNAEDDLYLFPSSNIQM